MKANRIFLISSALLFAAMCAAGTGLWLFRRTSLRLAEENAGLAADLRAARDAHEVLAAERGRVVADLEARLLRSLDELAAMKASMSTNASVAAKACEKLRGDLRRTEAEKSALAKALEAERVRSKTLEEREKAYSSVRGETDRRELDELMKLTDGAARKPAEKRR